MLGRAENRKTLRHLELSEMEWTVLKDICKVLSARESCSITDALD